MHITKPGKGVVNIISRKIMGFEWERMTGRGGEGRSGDENEILSNFYG